VSVLPPPETKAAYVEDMFARIAPGYDRVNRVMTFGLDMGWRQAVVDAVAPPASGRALLAAWMPDGVAVGVDFCPPMMVEGQGKVLPLGQRGAFIGGDALLLPFADESFDAITTGFAMRNVVDIAGAFREMWRVARPGGVVACLEVARPRNGLLRLGHRLYFESVVPWIGALLGGDRRAYTYLPQSARAFPPPPELAGIMREAGWRHVHYRLYSLGAVAIHTGVKLV
jgi:demethylmenaquinone methyltransferase / 2-methoxy-6-polyprenyl-1,4-benzoquinol methylase